MLADNPVFKKMLETGEEQFGRLVSQIVGNEKFVAALQAAVAKALEAKGLLDRRIGAAISAMGMPTTQDIRKLDDRLGELERIFEGMQQKLDGIASKLEK